MKNPAVPVRNPVLGLVIQTGKHILYWYINTTDESILPCRCSCGHCVAMPTSTESACCEEIPQIQEKKECEEVSCITLHPGFASVCLDVWVLQTAYFSLQQHYGSNAPQGTVAE